MICTADRRRVNIRLATGQVLQHTRPGTAFIINAERHLDRAGDVGRHDRQCVRTQPRFRIWLVVRGDPKFNNVPFSGIQGIDNLNAIGASGFTPPAAPPPGGGGDFGNSLSAGPNR